MRIVAIVARYLLGNHVHRIRPERLLTVHPPATADKSIGVAVLHRDFRVPLLGIFLRGPARSWLASALGILRTSSPGPAGCRDLQHPCVSPHDGASNDRPWPPGRGTLGARLSAVQRKLCRNSQRERDQSRMNQEVPRGCIKESA